MGATTCSIEVREKNNHFEKYLNGKGIDIGCGNDPLKIKNGNVDVWDLKNGDAQYLETIDNENYDFVYSSHCLEHMKDTEIALYNWSRVIKKDGYIFFVVPEYILYEKMQFPSKFNTDHKSSYSYYITKEKTKRNNHFYKDDIVRILENLNMEVLEVQLEDENYDYNLNPSVDQTWHKNALAQILFVARKNKITPTTQHEAKSLVLSKYNEPIKTNIRDFMEAKGHKFFKKEKVDECLYQESQKNLKGPCEMINNKIPVERIQTDYGELIILSKDTYQSNAFRDTKKAYDWQEVDLLNNIIKDIDNPIFFDVGSNLGAFTFGLAKAIKENNGFIYSFEPQRIVYNCLVGSIALNGYDHIYAYHAAIGNFQGDFIEAPQFNYAEKCSFGSIEFGEQQKEKLHQGRQKSDKKEYVKIFPLDDFTNKINKLDLLKIDVEGMEESVLESAKQIIAKHKPILFIEFFKSDKEKLRKMIEELGYDDISQVGVNFLCQINKIKKPVIADDTSVVNIEFSPLLLNRVDDNKSTDVSAISLSEIIDKKKIIDIVIVSYAKNKYCESLTRDCIKSLLLSEPNAENIFNIIVVESNPSVKWEEISSCVVTYEAIPPYGYHKFLNYGRKKGNSEWVALCNNDLQFTEGWFSKILKASELDPSVLSFSPLCPLTQSNLANKGLVYGHQVRKVLSGWCIVQKRSIYNIIGDLDENFYHWNCDSDYSMTLFKNDIKHVLVTDSIVIHHNETTGKTTNSIVKSDSEIHRLTIGCRNTFSEKYPIEVKEETLKRYEIINKIIKLNSYTNYLEIGIKNGLCFNEINCSKKTGVDPNSDHATYKMTSDDFFNTLKPEDKFDIIFIDGLHLEIQVDKDIENSIKYLKENGTIILYDCNPPSEYHAKENAYFGVPISGEWNGTVYKSLVKIRSKRNDLTLTTVDTGFGVGILTKEPSKTIETYSDTWDFFDANRKEILNLITPKQFEKIYNKSKKIGLCMIVKNESKIIERCLNSVKPLIDYVCIIDTGSTDDTVDVINNWMKSNDIDGEVLFEPWKDFAYNRSFAMKKIREKKYIDYVLMIDADEILMHEENINFLKIKENLDCDLYNITCKFGNIEYARTSITKNNMPYFYKGVVHEYLECEEHIKTRETIKGIYNIPFQDSARNQNIEKYQHDAKVLQDVLKIETDPFLISRYTFYLAQSYRDSLEKEKAIYWYNKRSKLGFWDQEVYISLYKIAKIKEELEYPKDDIIQSYMMAHEAIPERIEAIHGAISFCRKNGRNHQAYILSKHAISMPVNKTGLFSESWIWDYGIYDEFTISCYWSGHYKEGLEVSEKLLDKIPEEQKERILKNIKYLKEKLNSK